MGTRDPFLVVPERLFRAGRVGSERVRSSGDSGFWESSVQLGLGLLEELGPGLGLLGELGPAAARDLDELENTGSNCSHSLLACRIYLTVFERGLRAWSR